MAKELVCWKAKCGSTKFQINEYAFHCVYQCTVCHYQILKPKDECCRNPRFVNTIHYTGSNKVGQQTAISYQQCLNCGWADRRKPVKVSEADIRFEYSEGRFDEWKEAKHVEAMWLLEELRLENFQNDKYNLHLNSDTWKSKRKLVLQRDNNICQRCKVSPATEVHHLTYKNLGNEPLEDLLSVCHDCHMVIHQELRVARLSPR